jgi:4-hydroxythreonine-4-phosphate dehydrogenase
LKNKIIVITTGDPAGIGPEIIQKSLSAYLPRNAIVIVGEKKNYPNFNFRTIDTVSRDLENKVYFLGVNPGDCEPSFFYVETAVDLVLEGSADAIVTAPISKKKWEQAGIEFKGHTGYLARRSKVDNYLMFFWSENLKVPLYTTHIPLKDLFLHLNSKELIGFIRFARIQLQNVFKKDFLFLIPGINPHAGEEGLMGREEEEIILPVIRELQREMKIEGPYPPDTVYLRALSEKDSVVFSFFHDQGLIPFKLLNFNRGVNMTLGLPFIRTSPDHGPAFDIAGGDAANPQSMKEAILLADRLV